MMCDDFFHKSHYRSRSCLLMSLGPWLSALLSADKRFWDWAERVMLHFYERRCLHVGSRDVYGRDGSLLGQGGRHME